VVKLRDEVDPIARDRESPALVCLANGIPELDRGRCSRQPWGDRRLDLREMALDVFGRGIGREREPRFRLFGGLGGRLRDLEPADPIPRRPATEGSLVACRRQRAPGGGGTPSSAGTTAAGTTAAWTTVGASACDGGGCLLPVVNGARGRRRAVAGLDLGGGGRRPGRPDVGSRGWPGRGTGKPGSGVKIGQRTHLELHRGLEVAGGVRQDDGGRCVRAREQQFLRPDPRAREQRAPGRELPGSPLPLGLHPEGRCTTRRALQRIERRWNVVRVDADDPQVVERAIACDEKERREILAQQLETQLHVAGEPSAMSACNRATGTSGYRGPPNGPSTRTMRSAVSSRSSRHLMLTCSRPQPSGHSMDSSHVSPDTHSSTRRTPPGRSRIWRHRSSGAHVSSQPISACC
jgi:hypothetical protein